MSNIYYPVIRVPTAIQRAKVIAIDVDLLELPNSALVPDPATLRRPTAPKVEGMMPVVALGISSALLSMGVALITGHWLPGFTLLLIGATATSTLFYLSYLQFKRAHDRYLLQVAEYERLVNLPKKVEKPAPKEQPSERLQRLSILRDALQATQTFDGRDSDAKRGRSEADFESVLRQYFPGKIHTGVTLVIPKSEKNLKYTPDFALIDTATNLHIDIEIDEPYNSEGQPVHYLGLDDARNVFFLERNWILVRFAEEQVIRYPESCCQIIARIVADIIDDDSAIKLLQDVPTLPRVKCWSRKEAAAMAKKKHRGSY